MSKNYDYADDYADDVLNVSGTPWPGSQMVSRPRTITAPPPGQHVYAEDGEDDHCELR